LATGDPLLDFALSLRDGSLTPAMKAVSDANSAYAYVLFVPLIYWLLSRRIGFRLMIADAAGTAATVIMKDGLAMPRPPDAGETAWLASADGYGFPSGHTTAAATTWGTLAALTKRWPLVVFGVAVTAAVALSRMYLGVHYGRDVIGGAAVGLAIALAVLLVAPSLETRLAKLSRPQQYAAVLVFPAMLLLNSSREAIVIDFAAAGAVAGHLAANDLKWMVPTGDPRKLPLFGALRLAIGLPVIVLLAVGLGSPGSAEPWALAVRFGVLGAFVTLLGPRLFQLVEAKVRPKRAADPVT